MSDLGSIDFDDGQDFYFGEYEGGRNDAGERHGEGKEPLKIIYIVEILGKIFINT